MFRNDLVTSLIYSLVKKKNMKMSDEDLELDLDVGIDADDDDDLNLESDMDSDSSPKRSGILQSTSKRVRMIFSVMASPNRIDILRILNSKGPLTYSELKSLAGFKSKKETRCILRI